jgi:exopolysaccharide biosynthesis polyprenyl glycosylphosphotransferase
VVVLSFIVAFVLQDALREWISILKDPPQIRTYTSVALISVPIWLVLVPVFRLQMMFERMWSIRELIAQLMKHHLTGFLVLSVMLIVTQLDFNRSLIVLFMACSFCLMLVTRVLLGFRQWYDWEHGHLRPNVILVGDVGESMDRFIKDGKDSDMAPRFLGRVTGGWEEPEAEGSVSSSLPILGTVGELDRLLHEQHADQVIIYPPFHTPEAARGPLRACEIVGVQARLAIELTYPGRTLPTVSSVFGHPFVTFDPVPPHPERRALKHGFDAVTAALGILLLSPLFLAVAAVIWMTMGRPVFFVQKRAGRFGREFQMIKFRTMVTDAEKRRDDLASRNEMDGPVFKVTDDPRVTWLGRLLRRSSIDELPQLFNVLTGTMSLVGPRPLPTKEQQAIYGWHRRRLSMKPGITGLWQVSGRSNVDFESWMKLDLEYIDGWSLWLDFKILLRTIPAVILKKGAK